MDRIQRYLTRIWNNMEKCKWYEILLILILLSLSGVWYMLSKWEFSSSNKED